MMSAGIFFIFRSLHFILTKFRIYADRRLLHCFLVTFCYLTEADTAETAIYNHQEVEKKVTEDLHFISGW